MEGELIYLGFMMMMGQIIMLLLWQRGWFKKENFKIEIATIKATNKLNLRKLERDMGLTPSKKIMATEQPTLLQQFSQWAPLLTSLDGEQIKGLADRFLGTGEVEEGGGTDIDRLLNFAAANPEMAESFMQGITGAIKTGTKSTDSVYEM